MPRRLETSPQVLVSALVVSPSGDDHTTIRAIFARRKWRVAAVPSIKKALSWMARSGHPSVVICARDLPDGNWKLLFQETEALPQPPKFIVSSRLADDYLWVEVLNLGADNVLAVPFDAREVTHVVGCARDSWNERWGCAKPIRKAAAAAGPVVPSMLPIESAS